MLPRAKKSFGQNFLIDPSVVQKIVAAAEIKKGERVLEVGPGTGVLTEALIQAGAKVTAVEADKDLIAPLQEKFGKHMELMEGDILHIPLPTKSYKLVANIPYNITSELLHRFLTAKQPPKRMVLMVQKEVADRVTATVPDMSLLSVVCQLYAACKKVATVPAGAFRPIPKVDSAILQMEKRVGTSRGLDPERVIRLAKAGFSSKRKQLHNNLSGAGVASSEDVKKALHQIGLDPRIRPEGLTVENWLELAKVFHY